jgi:hypothetical protein
MQKWQSCKIWQMGFLGYPNLLQKDVKMIGIGMEDKPHKTREALQEAARSDLRERSLSTGLSLSLANGSSVLSEPAYVDSCLSKQFGADDQTAGNSPIPSEPAKIHFDLVKPTQSDALATTCEELSDELRTNGKILKASAAVLLSHLSSAQRCVEHRQPSRPVQSQQQQARAGQPQQKERRHRTKRCAPLQIATQLSELQSEDPGKIICVRKINRLGFDSADILKKHFEQYGPVDRVLLSNAHRKEPGVYSFPVRLRPSGIGFVVFETSQIVAQVLAVGESHIINGVEVQMRSFERRVCDKSSDSDDGLFRPEDEEEKADK